MTRDSTSADTSRLKTNVSRGVMGVLVGLLVAAGAWAVAGGGYLALIARRDDDALLSLLLFVLPGLAVLLLALGLWKSFFQPIFVITDVALRRRVTYRWREWRFADAASYQFQRVWVQPRRSQNEYHSTIPYWRDWLTIVPLDPTSEPATFLLPASDGNVELLASLEARSGKSVERLPSVDEAGSPREEDTEL